MVKSYLRYEYSKTFGVIASATANSVWTKDPNSISSNSSRSTGAGLAVVPANEEVLTWDIRKGELVSRWKDEKCKFQVTSICQSKVDPDVFAVGYSDGSIRLWDRKSGTVVISFNGHRAAVTTMAFDGSGTRLASGAKDAHIIVWDLIAEVGLYRLKGHKGEITKVEFMSGQEEDEAGEDGVMQLDSTDGDGWLVSTSKDTFIKLWELSTQHCIETHVAHAGECWSLAISPDQKGCVTAGNDGELKVWAIDTQALKSRQFGESTTLLERGTIYRKSKDRGVTITFHPSSNFIATHGTDKLVEIFRIRTEDEVKKVLKRKRKRKAEKGKVDEADIPTDLASATVEDIFVSYIVIHAGGKVKSIDWATKSGTKSSESLYFLLSLTNNSLEYYSVAKPPVKEKKSSAEVPEYNKLYTVEASGHRSDIRSLSLSSDDRMLASASNGSLKIWNVRTSTCIRTFECEYALCCSFLPRDKIVVVGTKSGTIHLFDIASSVLLETVPAHEGAIWSLQVHPDGKSLATASADKSAKFWDFEVVSEPIPGTDTKLPRLKLAHKRTLKINDDILSLRYTPSGTHLAVSLLDNTVKIFFTDTLKQLHNLYGHKLPVLNMDISSDSRLLITCSADKNVKIWGLDFGDCHKSFFAHNDSIMAVVFEKEGHNFWSASKDKLIKYWDGDKFENVMKVEGHFGEIWALCRGNIGNFLISASHDKSIRVWEQTDDQIFLEEEREKELEALYESTLTASLDPENPNNIDPLNPTTNQESTTATGKQTIETLMAGERIMEALDIGTIDLQIIKEWETLKASRPPGAPPLAPPQRNPIFTAYNNISAQSYLLSQIMKLRAAQLTDALLVLSFSHIIKLLTFIEIWTNEATSTSTSTSTSSPTIKAPLPLLTTLLSFILTTHHNSIVSSKTMRSTLDSIRKNLRNALSQQKDQMGFNIAAVRYIKMRVAGERSEKAFFEQQGGVEDVNGAGGEEKRKKRGFVSLS